MESFHEVKVVAGSVDRTNKCLPFSTVLIKGLYENMSRTK